MATEIMQLSCTHLSFAQHGFVPIQTRIAIFILPQMHYTLLALAFSDDTTISVTKYMHIKGQSTHL